jgi:isopropylmalate/homocitrate/citramalate synthase
MKEKWISDKWQVSEFNFIEDVVNEIRIPHQVFISDCTLREGEQQAGVVFNKGDKLALAKELDEIGVHEIDVGMPAVSREDEEAVKAIAREGLKAKVYAEARALKQDIDKVIECGVSGVEIILPAGHLQLEHKLKWSEERLINTALEMTDYAKAHGLWVNLSPYDTTRARLPFLKKYLSAVTKDSHVDRVRLVDSVGCAIPLAIKYLVKEMKEATGRIPIEVHCHNDFGLAVANTLAGVEAGANVVSTTINGMGERVGNAPTEEVALALRILYGVDLDLRFERFCRISNLVQDLSKVRLQPHKPVVGENAFRYESGMTVAGLAEDPFTGEAFSPDLVGQTRRIILGKKSGSKSIELKLRELGIKVPNSFVDMILQRVKEEAIKTKASVSDDTLKRIVSELANGCARD